MIIPTHDAHDAFVDTLHLFIGIAVKESCSMHSLNHVGCPLGTHSPLEFLFRGQMK